MPYIKVDDREKFNTEITSIVKKLTESPVIVGEVNYIISKIMWETFKTQGPSYTLGNNLMGVLECVKQEFYRRQLADYEDMKIKENGDI